MNPRPTCPRPGLAGLPPVALVALALLVALLALVAVTRPAAAAMPLDAWRQELRATRTLAENDAPAAQARVQRLQDDLPADAGAADKAAVLNLRARVETYLALTEPAAAHAREAFQIAQQAGDRIGQAEADLNTALNAINRGRMDEMTQSTRRSVTLLEGSTRTDLMGEALLRTTVMYRRFEQYNESAAVAVQAMEIARSTGDPWARLYAHHGLAIAYEQSFRAAESQQHYEQMRQLAIQVGSKLQQGFATAGMAGLVSRGGDLQRGEQMAREALALYRQVGVPYSVAFGLFGVATSLQQQGRLDEALALMDEAASIHERHPNRIGLWFVLNARSGIHQQRGAMDLAFSEAERALAIARDLKLAIYLSGSSTRMAALYAMRGDHRRAYELANEATTLITQASRETAGERMVDLIQRYEAEGRQRRIEELTRSNEQQAMQLRQRELQQGWLWTVVAAFGLGLIGTGYFVLHQRKARLQLQTLNEQLERTGSEIRALNTSLEERVQSRTAEVRQQARYLRTLIDMLPMWAWFKDTRSRYLVVNQAHASGRGLTVEQMVGHSDADLLPAPLARSQMDDDAQVMHSRERRTSDEALGGGADTVWMETWRSPVLDDDGTLLGTVGVARDVSAQKATERAREQALDEARRLARLRSDFLAQMSHELRTPLNGILGFAHLLRNDPSLTEKQERGLRIIEDSGRHLLALINDILDLARIDAAKLELAESPVALRGFLQALCEIVRIKAEEKGLAFVLQIDRNLPQGVRADETRLRQVLLNLLSNAVKFTDQGRVELRATRLFPEPPPADGRVRLRFEVQDQGIGMDAAQVTRLFAPFEQVSEARRRSGGSGLGLAISQQLVRLMGGSIQVHSQPGEGSSFHFELDLGLAQPTPGLAADPARLDGYQGARRRILVVDDLAHNRDMLVALLQALDFEVDTAADGAQALQRLDAVEPDLVVMDLTMPVMDGFEAIRRLRQLDRHRQRPVIASSAATAPDIGERAIAIGANAFVPKPVDPTLMLATIGQLLDLHWREAAPA